MPRSKLGIKRPPVNREALKWAVAEVVVNGTSINQAAKSYDLCRKTLQRHVKRATSVDDVSEQANNRQHKNSKIIADCSDYDDNYRELPPKKDNVLTWVERASKRQKKQILLASSDSLDGIEQNLDQRPSSPGYSPAPSGADSHPPTNEKPSRADLLDEISRLKQQLQKMERMLKSFLTDEQIQALYDLCNGDVKDNSQCDSTSIAQGLKFQFNLGTHGYNFLRSTNYPLPPIEILNDRLGDIELNVGVFENLFDLIQYKVQSLDPLDRLCTISLDEMKLDDFKSMAKNKQRLISGKFRENDFETAGNYITVVMVRGLRSSWEQVIACDTITSDVSSRTTLLEMSISFAEDCGLRVLSFSSNLSANSRLIWSAFGVDLIKSETQMIGHFMFNDHTIHVVPDVRYLLRSLKAAVDSGIHLSQSLVDGEALPSTHVSSKYVKELWDSETGRKHSSRLLRHLHEEDLDADDNDVISLESAIQFFSAKTATALESAVSSKTISPEALSTAYFCRLVDQWFSICNSKSLEDGLTVDNKRTKLAFLERFIDILHGVEIYHSWSPINAAMIISTVSLREVTNILLQQDGFGVVLLHRFSQDGVENVISRMIEWRGSNSTELSVESLNILKTVMINQLMSDVDRSFYLPQDTNNCLRKDIKSPQTNDTKKRSRKVLGRFNTSKTACTPRKRKRAQIESFSAESGVGKSKRTSKATKSKYREQKRKDNESQSTSATSKCVLGRPKRKYTKTKNEDFVYD